MNKLMVIMACLILLLSASAYGTSYLEGLDYWTNPRFSEEGDGYYDAFYGNWGEEALILSSIYGSAYEPMVADLNGDGTFDIVVHDSSGLIKVYDVIDRTLTLMDEVDTGSAPQAQHAIINSSQGGLVIVTLSDDIVKQYSFNSSDDLVLEASKDLKHDSLNSTAYTGFICTSRETSQLCLLGSHENLIYYYPDTNATSSAKVHGDTLYALSDWDNDGRIEAAVGCSATSAFPSMNISIIDLETEAIEQVFTGEGFVRSLGGTFYNIDGSGYSEFIGVWGRWASGSYAARVVMIAYNVAGGTVWNWATEHSYASAPVATYSSNPVVGSFTSSNREICLESYGLETDYSSNSAASFDCVTASTGVSVMSLEIKGTIFEPTLTNPRIYSVDMTGDGYSDILNKKVIYIPKDASYINHSCNNIYSALSDVDGDGDLDIVSTTTSLTEVCFSDFSNTNAVFEARNLGVNPFSLSSPICPGTTLTFSATECGIEPCHYTNDAETDEERLVTGCGYNSTYWTGDWSLATPSISCYYPSLGTFPVRVYIQDDSNTADYSEYKDMTVIVYNGTAGVTCNIAATLEDVQGSNSTSATPSGDLISDDDISQVEADITGQSSFLRWMIVLIVTGMILVALASQGVTSFAVYAISILCLWFAFAGIGMISGAIVFILVIVIIALSIGARVMSPGGGGG